MHLECLIYYSGFFLTTVNAVIHLDRLCYYEVLIGNSQKRRAHKSKQMLIAGTLKPLT